MSQRDPDFARRLLATLEGKKASLTEKARGELNEIMELHEKGDAHALYLLGRLCLDKNEVSLSQFFFEAAAKKGHEDARRCRQLFEQVFGEKVREVE